MVGFAAQDVAIREASQAGTLAINACEGRFGPFWSIDDAHGVIAVELSLADAEAYVARALA